MKTNNKGFSLVELIVVIAVMAILAAVAIPTFAGFITKANVASDESFANDVLYAAKIAHTVEGTVPDVTITAAKNASATKIEYTVGGVTYTIEHNGSTTTCKAGGTAVATGPVVDVSNSIDWSYKFKTADYTSGK